MQCETVQLGDLQCSVVLDGAKLDDVSRVVVLCHGFGAGGDDLVSIGAELLRANNDWDRRVGFVFPAAPIELEPGGFYDSRAWWPLNVERLMQAIEAKDFSVLRSQIPPGMEDASHELQKMLAALWTQHGLTAPQTILGGFSQGAMVSTEFALQTGVELAGICLMSGTLLCEERWRQMALQRSPLVVLQSHGTIDPILPYEGATALRDQLIAANHSVDFVGFEGMHAIPPQVLQKLAEMISTSLAE